MFIPYRCESCVYGIYLHKDSCYECSLNVSDDRECEENYEDDERT